MVFQNIIISNFDEQTSYINYQSLYNFMNVCVMFFKRKMENNHQMFIIPTSISSDVLICALFAKLKYSSCKTL